MSDTPRTDTQLIGPDGVLVGADFARQLERELARVQAVVEAAREINKWQEHPRLEAALAALDAKEVK